MKKTIELPTRIIPYATRPQEQCLVDSDCALVNFHDGPCYLTSWFDDKNYRNELRASRGQKPEP